MKNIIRSAIGTLFLISLLLGLLLEAINSKLLQERFWIGAIDTSGLYKQVLSNLDDFQRQSDTITKAKGLARITIAGLLTENRLQDVVSTNISRILGFAVGRTNEIIIYLPFEDWKIPNVKLARDTNLLELIAAGGIKPEQKQALVKGLETTQLVTKNINQTSQWILIGALVLLVGHFLLGSLYATAVLLLVSGLIIAVLSLFGVSLGWLISLVPQLPIWGKALASQLMKDFFGYGAIFGLVIAGVGGLVWWLTRAKAPAQSPVKNMVGVALTMIIILGFLAGAGYKFIAKFNIQLSPKQNWTLTVPKDWTSREEKGTKFFTNNKISISVVPLIRDPQMAKSDYLQQVVKNLSGSTYQRVFVGKPYQDQWQKWTRFVYIYDISDPKSKDKVRSLHWEILPSTGNGYNLVGATRATDWPTNEKQILAILESFKLK